MARTLGTSRTAGTYVNLSHTFQIAPLLVTTDGASSTSANSPVSALTATQKTLNMPDHAARLILIPTTDVRISESATQASYAVLQSGEQYTLDVGGLDNLYIKADSAAGNLSYMYQLANT